MSLDEVTWILQYIMDKKFQLATLYSKTKVNNTFFLFEDKDVLSNPK